MGRGTYTDTDNWVAAKSRENQDLEPNSSNLKREL